MNEVQNGNQRPPRRRPPNGQNYAHRQRQNGSSGNAHRNYERHLAMAREATQNGDIIEAENWYQHAEHYFRAMREGAN
jgi:Domain of unknown function (DUF4167)